MRIKLFAVLLFSACNAFAGGISFLQVQPQPEKPPTPEMDDCRWMRDGAANSVFLVSAEDRQVFADAKASFDLPREYMRLVVYFNGSNVDRLEWFLADPYGSIFKEGKDLTFNQKNKIAALKALIESK